jgi:UDP-glucose 4-epimerase
MKNILINSAGGYVGNLFTIKAHNHLGKEFGKIIATDIKENNNKLEDVIYEEVDVKSKDIGNLIEKYNITIVVHLAVILSSADNSDKELEYDIDVNGSKNILEACIRHKVDKFIFTSSGASYGYSSRSLNYQLNEKDELLGNQNVPYAYHKMLVENT